MITSKDIRAILHPEEKHIKISADAVDEVNNFVKGYLDYCVTRIRSHPHVLNFITSYEPPEIAPLMALMVSIEQAPEISALGAFKANLIYDKKHKPEISPKRISEMYKLPSSQSKYISGFAGFLMSELIEAGVNDALDAKQNTLTGEHISSVIQGDAEFSAIAKLIATNLSVSRRKPASVSKSASRRKPASASKQKL